MRESFNNFLQWSLWVKVAILVSVIWCSGFYIAIDSERIFDKTLFLLSLIPVILYWGMAWIFHDSPKKFNLTFLSVLILIAISIYGFITVDDYLTKEAARQQAVVSYTPNPPVDCNKLISSYRPSDTGHSDVITELEYEWCMKQKNKAE